MDPVIRMMVFRSNKYIFYDINFNESNGNLITVK